MNHHHRLYAMYFAQNSVLTNSIPWREQQKEAARLDAVIEANLKRLDF